MTQQDNLSAVDDVWTQCLFLLLNMDSDIYNQRGI